MFRSASLRNYVFVDIQQHAECNGEATKAMYGLQIALVSGAAALISVTFQGFSFNVNNNLFQTPIVEHWAADPAFAQDALIGSLQYYVSGVWAVLTRLPLAGHTQALFWTLHLAARWATLAVMCLIAANLGVTQVSVQIFLTTWLGLTGALRASTSLGNGDMFIDFFSHTEMTTPVMLYCLLLISKQRFFGAFAWLGVLFDINAFTAVWTTCAASFAATNTLWREPGRRKKLLAQAGWGIVAAVIFAAPVLYWIRAALTSQPAYRPFDYVEFLKEYYPNHFLIQAATLADLLIFSATVIATVLALRQLGHRASAWLSAFCGYIFVFVFGVFVPFFSHSPTLLNLHLLRVDGIIRVISVLILAIIATKEFGNARGGTRVASALALCFLSLPGPAAVVFGAVILCAAHTSKRGAPLTLTLVVLTVAATAGGVLQHKLQAVPEAIVVLGFMLTEPMLDRAPLPRPRVLGAVVALVVVPYAIFRGFIRPLNSESPREITDAAKEVALWARGNTQPRSLFLVPLKMEPDFELWSKRIVWVDWKQGAAVMWSPSFYWIWHPRMQEVSALESIESKVTYACRKGIQYVVVEENEGKPPRTVTIVKHNSQFMILKLPDSCRQNAK